MRFSQADVDAFNRKHRPPQVEKVSDDAIAAGTEKDLHSQIESDLRGRRWLYVHSRTDQKTTTAKGVPDFICFPPNGKGFFVEVKTRVGKLTPEQQAFKFVAELSGYRYEIVRSFKEWLQVSSHI